MSPLLIDLDLSTVGAIRYAPGEVEAWETALRRNLPPELAARLITECDWQASPFSPPGAAVLLSPENGIGIRKALMMLFLEADGSIKALATR